jgi:hypothetical protein
VLPTQMRANGPAFLVLFSFVLVICLVSGQAGAQISLSLTPPPTTHCTDYSSGPTLNCHWQNSNNTCAWGAGSIRDNTWWCNGQTAVQTNLFQGCCNGPNCGGCLLVQVNDACANNLTMDSACQNPTSQEFTETKTTYPSCGCDQC